MSTTQVKNDVATQELAEAPTDNLPAVTDRHQRPARKPDREREIRTISEIAKAIASIMQKVGIVPKAGVNQFHRYKYATMQDVLQRLTPLLAEHGLVIVQTELDRAMFDDDKNVAVRYQFTIAHSSGEVWPDRPIQTGVCRCRDSKGGFDDKAFNKCHTAARKYFLLALFQIATGEEEDADEDRGRHEHEPHEGYKQGKKMDGNGAPAAPQRPPYPAAEIPGWFDDEETKIKTADPLSLKKGIDKVVAEFPKADAHVQLWGRWLIGLNLEYQIFHAKTIEELRVVGAAISHANAAVDLGDAWRAFLQAKYEERAVQLKNGGAK